MRLVIFLKLNLKKFSHFKFNLKKHFSVFKARSHSRILQNAWSEGAYVQASKAWPKENLKEEADQSKAGSLCLYRGADGVL